MLAVCIPWTLRSPAWRSNELNSFMSRLLRRVHDADSYEHQAVPTVASAMINAVSGSIHFRFACPPSSGGKLGLGLDRSCFESVTIAVCNRRVATPVKRREAHRFQCGAAPG